MSFVLIGKLFSVIGVMFKVSSSFVFVTKAPKSCQPQEKHLLVSKKKYIFEMRISILYCPQISPISFICNSQKTVFLYSPNSLTSSFDFHTICVGTYI